MHSTSKILLELANTLRVHKVLKQIKANCKCHLLRMLGIHVVLTQL